MILKLWGKKNKQEKKTSYKKYFAPAYKIKMLTPPPPLIKMQTKRKSSRSAYDIVSVYEF